MDVYIIICGNLCIAPVNLVPLRNTVGKSKAYENTTIGGRAESSAWNLGTLYGKDETTIEYLLRLSQAIPDQAEKMYRGYRYSYILKWSGAHVRAHAHTHTICLFVLGTYLREIIDVCFWRYKGGSFGILFNWDLWNFTWWVIEFEGPVENSPNLFRFCLWVVSVCYQSASEFTFHHTVVLLNSLFIIQYRKHVPISFSLGSHSVSFTQVHATNALLNSLNHTVQKICSNGSHSLVCGKKKSKNSTW